MSDHKPDPLTLLQRAVRGADDAQKTIDAIAKGMGSPRMEVIERLQRAISTPVSEPLAKFGPRADENGSYGVFGA